MASKSIIKLFRKINPKLLHKKIRVIFYLNKKGRLSKNTEDISKISNHIIPGAEVIYVV